MTDWLYTAETGIADGQDVSTANSDDNGAGLAFTPAKAGGGTVKFSTLTAAAGTRAIAFEGVTTGDVARAEITGLFSSGTLVADIAFRTPAYPSAEMRCIEVLTGTTFQFRMSVDATGKIRAYDAGGGLRWTSTASVSTSAWWRLGFRITTAGALSMAYYSTYGATAATEAPTPATGISLGAGPYDQLRIGKITSAGTWAQFGADQWQISDTRSTLFGGPATSDTVSAGSDQPNVEPWSTVTLTATSSSGTVVWSNVSGPNPTLTGTGLSRTFTAPAAFTAATSVFRATNGTATDDVSVSYLPATDGLVTQGAPDPVVVIPVRVVRKT